ncbi:outer membrane beta-barrel protein [Spirosoma sp.]|uniref:outer membrane beta-barrel protein n=1 Tax=Spirosoma sp. TaxID=1899569 RepID=UPI002633A464|nr:outer membrane beta-barrel protein [Spirosoma sp.]MCX6215426.1 outer membrane beta-barrel protein [Spirosoma sp.]
MPTSVDIRTAKADYSRLLSNKWKLETGLKSAFVRTDNTITAQTGTAEKYTGQPLAIQPLSVG